MYIYCVTPPFFGLKQISFVVSVLHPQQLNVEREVSIVMFGFTCDGRSLRDRFLGLSFKLFRDSPSSTPPVGAVRMFFQFNALMFPISVVLLLFAGACRMGGGGLSISSICSLWSTERNSRM